MPGGSQSLRLSKQCNWNAYLAEDRVGEDEFSPNAFRPAYVGQQGRYRSTVLAERCTNLIRGSVLTDTIHGVLEFAIRAGKDPPWRV